MTYSDEEIRRRLELGEDSGWEFKAVEFAGDRPKSPSREDLADEIAAFANAGGRGAGPGGVTGAPEALPAAQDLGPGAEMLTKPPFVPVAPEVFVAAGMPSREDAEREAAGWLGDMIAGSGRLTWVEGGPGTVVAEPHPELPCVVFSGAREHEGVWVPTLFLMAGKRETDRYWQWASCGERKTPQLGADAVEGAEWVIEGLLPIARSSIRAPTA